MADEESTTPDEAETTPDEAETPEATATAEPDLSWKGHRLDEMGGAQVGKVEGRMSGRVDWLVARMGRFGHYCLVPGRDAVAANGRVWVPYTRDQIRRAPRVEPNAPLAHDSEQAVVAHYGLELET